MPLRTVDVHTLKNWLKSGEALVIDVREPAEHKAQHIEGATLLPLGEISKSGLPAGSRFVLHCKAGRRGGSACEKLLAEDPSLELYNLEGGLDAWMRAGGGVVSSGRFFLPLDRQVQLALGLLILLGMVLGYTLHTAFFLLPCFIGLGLVNAGLTGWCGLALLMAKMPWNQKI